ncbi:MAG: efflux RND transporter periplasmic adaptor subunit [Oceanobacter sp.]
MTTHQTGSGWKKLILIGATAAVLSACQEEQAGAGATAGMQMPPPQVDVVTVKAMSYQVKDTLPGRVTAYRVAEIRPQVSGIILKRFFAEGGEVKAGDKLYQIDPTLYQAQLQSARAQLEVARANERAAKLRAERYSALSAKSAISKQDVDDSDAQWKQAQAQVQVAEAAVRTAEVNLGYTNITAPISGLISRSSITEGALVSAQQASPLTVVRQISPVYVDVQVPPSKIMQIRQSGNQDTAVSLYLQEGAAVKETGSIQSFDVGVDEGTGTVNLRTRFENTDRMLLPGMFVRAGLTVDEIDSAILVPQKAVIRQPDGSTVVMTVAEGNKIAPRPVVVSRAVDDKWVVTSGLQGGETLVVAGLQKIRPDAVVTPNPVDASATNSAAKH